MTILEKGATQHRGSHSKRPQLVFFKSKWEVRRGKTEDFGML